MENFRAILCEVLNKTWVCHPFLGMAYALVSIQQSVKAISGLVNNFSSACHSWGSANRNATSLGIFVTEPGATLQPVFLWRSHNLTPVLSVLTSKGEDQDLIITLTFFLCYFFGVCLWVHGFKSLTDFCCSVWLLTFLIYLEGASLGAFYFSFIGNSSPSF